MSMTTEPSTRTATGPGLTTGTLVAGLLAVCLAQIGLAIPATLNGLFQSDLNPVGSQLTWISDAFLLPVAVLELTFGLLGDLFGRKRLLVGGASLLAVGELVSATSSGVHQLWTGQALAGLGAAALFPTSLAILAAGTTSPAQRARVIAMWAALLSTGGFLAPLLGGVTATYGSWRWSFVVVTVIAAASAAVSALFATNSSAPEGRSLDLAGQLTIGLGLFALLYAIIQGPTDGWSSPRSSSRSSWPPSSSPASSWPRNAPSPRFCAWTCSATAPSRWPRSSPWSACSPSWAPPTPSASGSARSRTRHRCARAWPSSCSTASPW